MQQRKKTMEILSMRLFLLGSTNSTFDRGFFDSKEVARQVGTATLLVNFVIDQTLFSRSLVKGSFGDTREGSVEPE
jgi:hypothetical protein